MVAGRGGQKGPGLICEDGIDAGPESPAAVARGRMLDKTETKMWNETILPVNVVFLVSVGKGVVFCLMAMSIVQILDYTYIIDSEPGRPIGNSRKLLT